MMEINYLGYVYCTYYALPHLKKSRGQIGVVGSLSGEFGLPFRTGYCGTKFAVKGLCSIGFN
jgi:NADP-dependent 3-hydroxy acid dehydrogenase YdfG